MTCHCDLCKRSMRVKEIAAKLPVEDAEYLWAWFEEYEAQGFDLSYHQAVADGSWPNAKHVLARWAANAEKRA